KPWPENLMRKTESSLKFNLSELIRIIVARASARDSSAGRPCQLGETHNWLCLRPFFQVSGETSGVNIANLHNLCPHCPLRLTIRAEQFTGDRRQHRGNDTGGQIHGYIQSTAGLGDLLFGKTAADRSEERRV